MSTLFDTDEAPVALATGDQIRELVDRFAYKKERVEKWTREKADTVLGSWRKQVAIVEARATAKAQEQDRKADPQTADASLFRFDPTSRSCTRIALEEAIAEGNTEQLCMMLGHATWAFTKAEMFEYAGLIVCQLKVLIEVPEASAELAK